MLGAKELRVDAIILDDCDRDTYGLQQATEFIKGRLQELQNIANHLFFDIENLELQEV